MVPWGLRKAPATWFLRFTSEGNTALRPTMVERLNEIENSFQGSPNRAHNFATYCFGKCFKIFPEKKKLEL